MSIWSLPNKFGLTKIAETNFLRMVHGLIQQESCRSFVLELEFDVLRIQSHLSSITNLPVGKDGVSKIID